ncbi:tetratricopeptide repeat protein [Calidithermus timidus]|jgi:mono/diheme cytochrome c family protein|uniref:tetratricopeptide repeat protein n=1 Tax=Calidithermus timidus TaxID=307124 RepID=UPI0003793329|nr:tetratricopeptide repeat protein [Calidithermus timidus]
MIPAYLFTALLVLAALAYILRPLLKPSQPFPQSPRPQELRAEVELLKNQAREAAGEERKRLLAQAVRLERELADLGQQAPTPRPLSPATLALVAVSLLAVGVGLWRFTVPRLPGETIITSRAEAARLRDLEAKARQSNHPEAWLAYANQAWEVRDFERASQGYLQVLKLEPRNVLALRRLGILLFFAGRGEQALPVLELATRADPSEPEGWLFLGNIYFQAGRPQDAISAWERYKAAGGSSPQVDNLIQTARQQLQTSSAGQRVYLQKCAACHGAQAQGDIGPALKGNPISKVSQAVSEIVSKGRGSMPAVPLSAEELEALLDYLKTL